MSDTFTTLDRAIPHILSNSTAVTGAGIIAAAYLKPSINNTDPVTSAIAGTLIIILGIATGTWMNQEFADIQ